MTDPNSPQYQYTVQSSAPARQFMPQSELQFQMATTESTWGKPEMNPEIKDALTETIEYMDETGQRVHVEKKQLWERFNIYTRDMRLGFLKDGEETENVRYMLDLAFQLMQKDMYRAAAISLGYVATVLETSQSRNGNLRKRMNTLTNENINQQIEPPKKTLFGRKGGD